MFDLNTWVEKAVGVIATWVVWITVKIHNLEKVMLTREEHDKICEKRHDDMMERFRAVETKQDEMMSLLIDVIRK